MLKHILLLSAIIALSQCHSLAGPEIEGRSVGDTPPNYWQFRADLTPAELKEKIEALEKANTDLKTELQKQIKEIKDKVDNAGTNAANATQPSTGGTDTANATQPSQSEGSTVDKPQGADSESKSTTAKPEGTSSKPGSESESHITDSWSQIDSQVQDKFNKKKATFGQVFDRLGDAARQTVIEEKKAIGNVIKSVKSAAKQTAKAGLNIVKSKFDLLFMGPKFALNALGLDKPSDKPGDKKDEKKDSQKGVDQGNQTPANQGVNQGNQTPANQGGNQGNQSPGNQGGNQGNQSTGNQGGNQGNQSTGNQGGNQGNLSPGNQSGNQNNG